MKTQPLYVYRCEHCGAQSNAILHCTDAGSEARRQKHRDFRGMEGQLSTYLEQYGEEGFLDMLWTLARLARDRQWSLVAGWVSQAAGHVERLGKRGRGQP